MLGKNRLSKIIKKIDKVLVKKSRNAFKKRYILFYVHNIMNLVMVFPLYKELVKISSNRIFFTSSNSEVIKLMSDDFFDLSFFWSRFISLRKAQFLNWDVIICADYWLPWFYRYTTFVQIFHGVAAKMVTGMIDYRFHPAIKRFDLLFFPNSLYREIALSKGLTSLDNSYVAGMPVLDDLVNVSSKNTLTLEVLDGINYKFDRIVMWAPTFSALNLTSWMFCKEILGVLASLKDSFVVIKPHPKIFEFVDRASFEAELREIFVYKNFVVCYSNPYPFIAIADLYIGDFSSLTLERTVVKKPIILFDNPCYNFLISDKDQVNLLREASFLYSDMHQLKRLLLDNLTLSQDKFQAMKAIKEIYFENLGNATRLIISVLREKGLVY